MLKAIRLTVVLSLACLIALPALAAPGDFQPLKKAEPRETGKPGVNKMLDCTGAIPVMLDATYVGTTVGAPSNVSDYSCSFFVESGPEVVFILELPGPSMFTIDLIPEAGVDLDLAVLDQCDADLGCQIVADTGVETLVPIEGTLYLVVDGYNGAEGSFELVLESQPLPEPLDFCEQLLQPIPGMEGEIVPEGVFNFSGDTCDGVNDFASLDCGDFTENGFEDYWEFMLLPGASIDVEVTNTADGALWLVDNCKEPLECLAYADDTLSGDPEAVSYMNTGDFPQLLILVVDSYGTDTCGTFDGTVTVYQPGVIPAATTTWGAVKTRY